MEVIKMTEKFKKPNILQKRLKLGELSARLTISLLVHQKNSFISISKCFLEKVELKK